MDSEVAENGVPLHVEDNPDTETILLNPGDVVQLSLNEDFILVRNEVLIETLQKDLNLMGGWDRWLEALRPFQTNLYQLLEANQGTQPGMDGFLANDNFLFSTGRLKYLLGQHETIGVANALASIVQSDRDLQRKGIRLIVMPVPPRGIMYLKSIVMYQHRAGSHRWIYAFFWDWPKRELK